MVSIEEFIDLEDKTGRLQIALDTDAGKKKKRKKKNFVSKKRVPHVRAKAPLKLLKLFKAEKSGEVTELRERCPECAGCFLAKHKDGRLYCGNCHYTKAK